MGAFINLHFTKTDSVKRRRREKNTQKRKPKERTDRRWIESMDRWTELKRSNLRSFNLFQFIQLWHTTHIE